MALSPYKSAENSLNRSRSSSCSSPIRNSIIYQEVYSVGSNTLIRSYSCSHVVDKDSSGRTFQTTQIQVSSFMTPEKKIRLRPAESQLKNQDDKIVLNKKKTKAKNKTLALECQSEDPDSCEKKAKTQKKSTVLKTFMKKMILSLLAATAACAALLYINYKECGYVWDLEKTEGELKQYIFGQDQAIDKINSVLKICNSTNDAHIMVFIGDVGTGKTYSSSIISRNFPWSSNKLITYSEYFSSDVEQLLNQKLSTCGCNLIVVDDLSNKSTKEAINLVALLNNSRKNYQNLLVILIFLAQTENDRNEIVKNFKDTYLNIYYVSFKPLTKDVVKKCYESEIKRQGVVIPKEKIEKLVEEKIKHIDIVKGTSGCKGVAEEVAYFYKG